MKRKKTKIEKIRSFQQRKNEEFDKQLNKRLSLDTDNFIKYLQYTQFDSFFNEFSEKAIDFKFESELTFNQLKIPTFKVLTSIQLQVFSEITEEIKKQVDFSKYLFYMTESMLINYEKNKENYSKEIRDIYKLISEMSFIRIINDITISEVKI